MCIIIGKMKGTELPTPEVLDNCFRANRDGIGIAWTDGNGVVKIKKDFETLEAFKTWLPLNVDKNEHACVIHYRLATSGKTDCGNRHPFPVSKDKVELRKVEVDASVVVAHNGVFHGLGDKKYSDTQEFIADILADELIVNNIDTNKPLQELLCGYLETSKLMMMWGTGKIWMFGKFEKEKDLYFSNKGYESWGGWKGGNNSSVSKTQSGYDDIDYYELGYGRLNHRDGWKDWAEGRVWDNSLGRWVDKPKLLPQGTLPKEENAEPCINCFKLYNRKKMVVVGISQMSPIGDLDYMCRACFFTDKKHQYFKVEDSVAEARREIDKAQALRKGDDNA